VTRTPTPREGHREIAIDSPVNSIEAEVRVEPCGNPNSHGSVHGLEVHVVGALQGGHSRVNVSIHRLGGHGTVGSIDVYPTIHGVRPHRPGRIPDNHSAIHGRRAHFGPNVAHRDATVHGVRPDLQRLGHANRDLDVRMVFVVAVVVVRLYFAVLAARAVVPDRADRHVAARLDDFVMNVVHLAPTIQALFGNEVNHVVRTRREFNGPVHVEHVHPVTSVYSPIPTPCIRVTTVLLLRTDRRSRQHDGESRQKSRSIHLLSGWLSLNHC
jgi:hypothetical protein